MSDDEALLCSFCTLILTGTERTPFCVEYYPHSHAEELDGLFFTTHSVLLKLYLVGLRFAVVIVHDFA